MPLHERNRRDFLQALPAGLVPLLAPNPARSATLRLPAAAPVAHRPITRPPGFHWFGYYDKLQFDPDERYVLGMRTSFEHRTPRADDTITIGMVDLADNDRWIELGQSSAWCWQQGCMLQWVPGSKSEVIWNDRAEDHFVSHILNTKTGDRRTLDQAVYAVSPDGRSAVTADFRRIQDVRPGYGYVGFQDPNTDDLAPRDSGIFHVDLQTGRARLILSLADVARMGRIPRAQPGIKHYFNHLLFSPDGQRFIALHRWRYPDGSRLTRLITACPDGTDVRIVIPNGYASHFIWRDSEHILVQSRRMLGRDAWGNYLVEDQDAGGKIELVGPDVLDSSGHISYLPGNDWILNDTYPKGRERLQTPHLYEVATQRRIDLASFRLPPVYKGEWRVDTHPRFSPSGQLVCIDAPIEGQGRQLHLIDISSIVEG